MAANDLEKEIQELRKELGTLQQDVVRLADESGKATKRASDSAQEAAATALAKLEAEAQKLMDKLHDAGERAVRGGETVVAGVEESIQERPLVGTAAALGIGFVLGMLLNRRS